MLNFSVSDQEQPKSIPLPEIPWERIVGRLEKVALEIKSFDARLEAAGLSAGWQSRCDMNEAVRSLLLDGHLVDIGDLVLHDDGMDVRSPTHEITRAASALRARTAMALKAPWPISYDGLGALRRVGPVKAEEPKTKGKKKFDPNDEDAYPAFANDGIRGRHISPRLMLSSIGPTRFLPAKRRCPSAARTWSMIRTWTRLRMRTPGLIS